MAWQHGPLLGFDTESTSVDPLTAELVPFALCWFDGDTLAQSRYALVDAGVEIPESATKIHGISTDDVRARGGSLIRQVEGVGGELLKAGVNGVPVVGFNVAYDLTLLMSSASRLGVPLSFSGPVIDPLVMDRHCDRYRKGSRKLTAVAEHYGVDLPNAHHALADAIGAVKVARAIAAKYPEVGHADLDVLFQLQRGWHREWAEEYSEYRVSKGEKPLDPSEFEWPIRGLA